jgi:hypothetical protein
MLPTAGMLDPKHNHDAHNGTLKAADTWLRGWLPLLLADPDYTSGRRLLFVVLDEGTQSYPNDKVLAVDLRASSGAVTTFLDHCSLARTYEEIVGVPLLNNAASSPSPRQPWRRPPTATESRPRACLRLRCTITRTIHALARADLRTRHKPVCARRPSPILGIMSWDDPAWEAPYPAYAGNQNGTFPFTRDSTAAAADYWGAYIRGCYNGWETWLDGSGTGTYAAGDIWGCIGSWYSGDWHSSAANGYISRVQNQDSDHTWLTASFDDSTQQYDCNVTYGCPK